jgi:hypothetical protein
MFAHLAAANEFNFSGLFPSMAARKKGRKNIFSFSPRRSAGDVAVLAF